MIFVVAIRNNYRERITRSPTIRSIATYGNGMVFAYCTLEQETMTEDMDPIQLHACRKLKEVQMMISSLLRVITVKEYV